MGRPFQNGTDFLRIFKVENSDGFSSNFDEYKFLRDVFDNFS